MDEILTKITPTLRKLAKDGHDIVVEGHTDDIPIHNAHFSLELGTLDRASNERRPAYDSSFGNAARAYGRDRVWGISSACAE